MSIKTTYNLRFSKTTGYYGATMYFCDWDLTIPGSLELGTLLQGLSDREPDLFLEDLNFALSGGGYEEDYHLDGVSSIHVNFLPPNAQLITPYSTYSISLLDLKELLEDWIAFVGL